MDLNVPNSYAVCIRGAPDGRVTAYKAVSSSSKSGMFVYLNDMLIEGNAHRKRCWKWAPTRPTGALELCALVDRRVP